MLLELYVRITNWLRREEGQDLIEYALLLGLIALALIVVLPRIGQWVLSIFTAFATALEGSG
jgi:Flp pilus assembly pilin Flp